MMSPSGLAPALCLSHIMNRDLIVRVLESPSDDAIQALLDDEDTVFWVDWRADDDGIVESCETIIKTGSLSAELIDVETENGCDFYISYKDKRVQVPLTYSLEDRHITICALNEALAPDYEVRLCIDSSGSDTLGFLPLFVSEWNRLEGRYGDAVKQRFYRIAARPNIYTDVLPF
jgi:hypothetical protein